MQIKRHYKDRLRPRIENNIVHIPGSKGLSRVYVDTENFIAVDYMRFDVRVVEWYFYLDKVEVKWSDLDDKLRLLVRTDGTGFWGSEEWNKFSPGEYEDSRYYILEGLEAT